MINKVKLLSLLLTPIFSFGQMIESFDQAPEDSTYWGYEINMSADTTVGFVNVSYVTDPVAEGSGALQLEYSVHNTESWGGFSKIYHYANKPEEIAPELEGVWRLAPDAGALKVGPAPNNGEYWSSTEEDIVTRACLFDDEYVFNSDGSFQNILGESTWIEDWQSGGDAACGAPVAPHDGSNVATWEFDETASTVTLNGVGAYLGIAKAFNGGELGSPDEAPESITYDVTMSASGALIVVIEVGDALFWTFRFISGSIENPGSLAGAWMLAPEAGALKVGPGQNDGSWWSNNNGDVTIRGCLFDDQYVFNSDGSFQNIQDNETWIEPWQGQNPEACGAPVAPHDGSNAATWEFNEIAGTITLNGLGAYIGIAKAFNGGECTGDGVDCYDGDLPESITYEIYAWDESSLTIMVNYGAGYWTIKLVPAESVLANGNNSNETWNTILDMRPDYGTLWDWTGYDSISFSYNNLIASELVDRVHIRLNLSDYAGVPDPTTEMGLGEYFYSFHYILDDNPGWNTVTIPLVNNYSSPEQNGGGFNLTGWAGASDNGEIDLHAIGGFHFEFSISSHNAGNGGVDGDFSGGTIIIDDFKLTGSQNVLSNPGFELEDSQGDGLGWGSATGGGHADIVTDASVAHNGDNYLNIGVTDSWVVYYSEDSTVAEFGETWRFSGYAKSFTDGDGSGAALKLEAKDGDGNVIESSGDIELSLTSEWEKYSMEFVMPTGTESLTAVIVASRSDGVACDFAFDDMFLLNVGVLDIIPPMMVEDVEAIQGAFYNLVIWADVEDEIGEKYTVYASTEPIEDLESLAVADVVGVNILEGAESAVHYLFSPLEDEIVTYYYAVTCKDESNNVGEPGVARDPITNGARGIPTISLTVPEGFAADGDISEWEDSGIEPFELSPMGNSWNTPNTVGDVSSPSDLSARLWLAVDDDYLYLATDVIDDVYDGYVSGEATPWYENDVLELFIGFYDQRGAKHSGMQRGAEPDYKFWFGEEYAVHDFNGGAILAENGDGNYYQEGFDPDWVVEARLSLDDIPFENDIRLDARNGMRIPIEPTYHDNDGSGWEGNVVGSPSNDDLAYQTPSVWSSTWIGDQSVVVSTDDESGLVAYDFALLPNYPNPFNPSTTIKFSLPETQSVTLKLFNIMGQEVAILLDGRELQAGFHTAQWNARNMASGVYFYQLISDKNNAITQKMLLVK